MAHHGAQPEQIARKIRNGHVYARFGNDSLRRRRNGGQSKKHSGKGKVSHHYGDYAFESVAQKVYKANLQTERARHIHGAGIAAALGTYILVL